MATVIDVDHLHKRYGDFTAVEDVSFRVDEGEIFGILGPNGAGKTTTVECIQGLREPTGGNIRMLGVDAIRQRDQLRRRIGSQLQESALPERIKVWEALDLFASLDRIGPDWQILMDQWGLTDRKDTAFADLSGGQRQRLFVALALINEPEIVFLDELTQGLDPAARMVAWNLIREIRERGTTVVLVTHYMDEAEALCDRLAVIHHGRVIATGSPQELVANGTSGVQVRFTTDAPDISWLDTIECVESVQRNQSRVEVRGSGAVLALVASELVSHGIVPTDLRAVQPSLETIYFELIGSDRKGETNEHAG